MSQDIEHTMSSGNVFADLELSEPEELLAKARLMHRISEIVEGREWTSSQTAAALNVDEPTVSALLRGRLADFSIERLFRFLNALGQEVEISVHASRAGPPGRHRRHHRLTVACRLPPAGYRRRCRGSSASRRPSPIRLKESTVRKIARPGKTVSHQAPLCRSRWPSCSMLPQLGVGIWTPRLK